uniref:GRANULINS domain-containing protein n=1 Tax=Panagrellus redivivus TaxID=6233 RepID=A0A7E4VRS7_PANRE
MSLKVVCLLGLGFLSVVAGLDRCFTGDGTAKSGWTKDPCASGWCLTLGGSDDVQDHRECDTSGVCEAYGAKCGPPVVRRSL